MLTTTGQVPFYLIIDALDECPNDSALPSSREKVLKLVKDLVGLHQPNLRLYITSRPEFDIRTTLEPLATQQVSLHDESGLKQDINDYINNVVRSDRMMKRWREDDKDAVIESLTKRADGMFLWVSCQLEVLRYCLPTNIRRVLKEFPKSLDETYIRILHSINNVNSFHVYRILQFIVGACRPLRVEELADVLAFDFTTEGIPKLCADWRWKDPEAAVLSACSSLVAIVIDDGSRVVQFSHFSVEEFLTSDRLANSTEEVSRFYIPIEPCHAILAQACLSVLLYFGDRTDKASIKEKIPLLQYAAENWYRHAAIGKVEFQIADAMDRFFDMDEPYFSAWVQIQDQFDLLTVSESEQPSAMPLPAAPFYFAARMGFCGLVERLILKHPQQVNHLGGLYGTPLHGSVLGGHIAVAKLLITYGADVNSRSADNWTPLHIASREGHLEIGKLLLKLGANVNFQKDGQTPLHFATSHGHLEVSRLLLQYDAEVNAGSNLGSTPLLHASLNGTPDVVRLLLNHNADAHIRDNNGDTSLHLAATYGHLKVAQLLLEHNAEVDPRNDLESTPLLHASSNGSPDVVRLLLDHNADAHVRDNNGDTPLHLAATCGYLEVAQLLLERNAEVNSRNILGSTPLLDASANGNPDVVRLLLDHNANAHVQDNNGDTPLHSAATYGHLDVVRLLLKYNAKVDAINDLGSTPLSKALANGNPDVVRLLLDNGADADVRDNNGDTPLHSAATYGHLEVVRLLLEHNAEVNALNDLGSTPLLKALDNGNPDVVRLLLDNGAAGA
ncbi:Ankyrin repeat-containing domain protein [Lactarius tabidus]